MNWEYRVEEFTDWNTFYIRNFLDVIGKDRWELVSVLTDREESKRTYFFKRELKKDVKLQGPYGDEWRGY